MGGCTTYGDTVPVEPLLGATALNSSGEWIAALIAILAAGVYVIGMAFQQKGNLAVMARAAEAGTPDDAGARKVLANGLWWVGMGTMILGFVLHAVALGLGSLAVVQPLQVTEIIFMIPASAWVAHVAITRRDWLSAGAVAIGLAMFLIATQPGQGNEVAGGPSGWITAFVLVFGAAAVLYVTGQRTPRYKAALLGAMTGVIYGLQGALLKQATGQLGDTVAGDVSTWWAIPTVMVVNVIALVGQNLAMRAGRLSAALSTITVFTPAVSTLLGITLFGETLNSSAPNVAVAALGVIITVAGVVQLAASPALLAVEGDREDSATGSGATIDSPPLAPIVPPLDPAFLESTAIDDPI